MLSNNIQDIWPLLLIFSDLQLAFLHLPGLSPTGPRPYFSPRFQRDPQGANHRAEFIDCWTLRYQQSFESWLSALKSSGPEVQFTQARPKSSLKWQCRIATAVDPKCCNYCTVCSTQVNTCIMANANVTHPNLDHLGSKLSFLRFSISLSFLKLHYQSAKFLQGKIGAPQNGPNSWNHVHQFCTWWKSWWKSSSIFDTNSAPIWCSARPVRPPGASPKQIEDLRADRISATSPHLCNDCSSANFCKVNDNSKEWQCDNMWHGFVQKLWENCPNPTVHYPYQMTAIVYMWVYPIFRHTHMMKTARRQSKVND